MRVIHGAIRAALGKSVIITALLASSGLVTVISYNLVSTEGGSGRFEPSSAAGSTWATSWFDLGQSLSYVNSWNGSGWNTPVNIGVGYSNDSQGSSWTVAPSPAFASSSTVHWDRPSVAVDASGRVIIGGVKFQFNPADNKFEDAGFFAAVDNSGAGTSLNPTQVGNTAGALSRVVATNNTFEAFIPTLVGADNQMTALFRMESTDGSTWSGPFPIASFPTNPPLIESPMTIAAPSGAPQNPATIFYAAYLDAQGFTNGQWAVTWPSENSGFNNLSICTSDRGCGILNAAADDQFVQGTSVSGDPAQYWVSYYTYSTLQARGLPLLGVRDLHVTIREFSFFVARNRA